MKKLLKTKKDKEQFLFWVATLESGVLRKGTQHLKDERGGYCCLGVAAACTTEVRLTGLGFPSDVEETPVWLKNIDADYSRRTDGPSLAEMNDGDGTEMRSHREIARLLLETYKDQL